MQRYIFLVMSAPLKNYYLLSKELHLERFFESVEEIDSYIWAKTGVKFFSVDFVKEHLHEHMHYSYQYRGIDISIFKRTLYGQTDASQQRKNPGIA